MNRAAAGLLTVGVMLFFAVLASQGLPTVLATLGMAGWGLVLVPRRAARTRCGGAARSV